MSKIARFLSLITILLLFRPFFTEAQPVAIARSGMVGKSIAQFVPEGFDANKTPSLILESEPVISGRLPSHWKIYPEFSVTGGKASAIIHLKGKVSLYGGGEVTGTLLRNGQTIRLWNTDSGAYGVDGGSRLYQSHPWVMGLREDGTAFGVIFDSFWKAELRTDDDKIEFNTDGALFNVYVIDRNSPQEVLQGLAELIGTIDLPPRWSLGYQQCRFSYGTEQRVREIASTFRAKQLPCDVIWMDIDYMDGYRVFTFNKAAFPNPKQLNADLHAKGFRSVFMIDPGVKVDAGYDVYNSGTKQDVWLKDPSGKEYHGKVWPGDCAFPDFTMPRTQQWWADLYKPFLANDIDGVWNDMNEPAVNDNELPESMRLGTIPYDIPHRGGADLPAGPHLLYHNAYGRLMVDATRKGVLAANPEKRPFVLTRSNLLGGQRYAATWTGDNYADEKFMKVTVPMSVTLGLSGQPFSGPDIGGFLGNTSPDLWGQWIGFGVFLPFARGHACAGTNDKEPWAFGPELERTSKIALERRYRLLPYLYTLFYNAHKTGLPVMCPAFFDDPGNAALRSEEQIFLLGKNLLVVPAFAQSPNLPEGIWETLNLVDGDQSDRYQAKLLVKGGGIVPAGEIIQNTTEESLRQLTLYICLDAKGKAGGELYWDAGEGWDFKKNGFKLLNFQASRSKNLVSVSVKSASGNYDLSPEIRKVKAIVLHQGKQYEGIGSLKDGVQVNMH